MTRLRIAGDSEPERRAAALTHEWALLRLRAVASFPRYGSIEWSELDDRDPAKVAAVVLAAEVHRIDGLPEEIRRRLASEIQAGRAAEQALQRADEAALAHAVRNVADVPTISELRRRRSGGAA